jgi:outer membrane lipoprotein LolB
MRRAWVLAALLAGACAQMEIRPPAGPLEFELSGRIAARYGDDAFTGNVLWRHASGGDEMMLNTPMGQGVARIVRQGEAVVLTTAEPREYRAVDVETLTQRVLGFRLPLVGLADWVRGRPTPGKPARTEHASDGRLRSLEQDGWNVQYLDYAGGLPSRLRLDYQGIELRLAVSQWN